MFDSLTDFLEGVAPGSRLPNGDQRLREEVGDRGAGHGRISPRRSAGRRLQVHRELRGRERWFELTRAYRAHIAATIPPAEGA